MDKFDPIIDIARLVAAGIAGGLITALANHYFTKSRERAAGVNMRRREFIAFMHSWKVEVSRKYMESGGYFRHASSFCDVLSEFVAQSKRIREDFQSQRRLEFDGLEKSISSIDGRIIHNNGGYEQIDKALQDMIVFVEG